MWQRALQRISAIREANEEDGTINHSASNSMQPSPAPRHSLEDAQALGKKTHGDQGVDPTVAAIAVLQDKVAELEAENAELKERMSQLKESHEAHRVIAEDRVEARASEAEAKADYETVKAECTALQEEMRAKDLVIDTLKQHIAEEPPESLANHTRMQVTFHEKNGREESKETDVCTSSSDSAKMEVAKDDGYNTDWNGDGLEMSADIKQEDSTTIDIKVAAGGIPGCMMQDHGSSDAQHAKSCIHSPNIGQDEANPMQSKPTLALLDAAFDCDIDTAMRLYQQGAALPELWMLILELHKRQLPTESEATAIYVIEGLRNQSSEGQGATAALMQIARTNWDELPDLGSTLKSICMVADAEFSETTQAVDLFLQQITIAAGKFAMLFISRSVGQDPCCEQPRALGVARHEALTLLAFVCSSSCQRMRGWATCIRALHAAGVLAAAVDVAWAFPLSNMAQVKVVEMLSGILHGTAQEGMDPLDKADWGAFVALVLKETDVLPRLHDDCDNQQLLLAMTTSLRDVILTAADKYLAVKQLIEDCPAWESWARQGMNDEEAAQAKWFQLTWQHEASTDRSLENEGHLEDTSSDEDDEEDGVCTQEISVAATLISKELNTEIWDGQIEACYFSGFM